VVVTERAEWLRVLRVVAVGAYAGLLVALWKRNGIPLDREQVLLWLGAGLVVFSIGSPRGGPWRVVRDWLPVLLVLILYDLTRGKADDWLGITAHVDPQLTIDRWIGLGEVPTLRLQHALYHQGEVQWWEVPVTLTYISHFFVPFVVAGVFWLRDRDRYWRYIRRFVTLSFAAAVTFVLFPAVPPWLAARHGELDVVVRTTPRGWSKLHLDIAHDVLELGQRTSNVVAAIPSLHAGYTALVLWALWPSFGRIGRTVLVAYPLAMAFTLVLTGEHYLVDVLIGWGYAALVIVVWDRIEPWWTTRSSWRPRSTASPPSPATPTSPSPPTRSPRTPVPASTPAPPSSTTTST
jgi:membrane-associated phospholipid phosphatase